MTRVPVIRRALTAALLNLASRSSGECEPVMLERLTSGSNGPGLALFAPAAEPSRWPV